MERNEMKTIAAFTMALATLVLASAADADAQDRRCYQRGPLISVRAGTPCSFWIRDSFPQIPDIIERPNGGTAVLRADGKMIYYSPKPGFTGRDRMRVRRTGCDRMPICFAATYIIFVE
jgi:hypothetical protein